MHLFCYYGNYYYLRQVYMSNQQQAGEKGEQGAQAGVPGVPGVPGGVPAGAQDPQEQTTGGGGRCSAGASGAATRKPKVARAAAYAGAGGRKTAGHAGDIEEGS